GVCEGTQDKITEVRGSQSRLGPKCVRWRTGHCDNGREVVQVGSAGHAAVAEDELNGATVADDLIAREIAPCFVDDGGRRTDTVVLACTHYPLLLDRFERLAPWPGTFGHPPPATARRARRFRPPP